MSYKTSINTIQKILEHLKQNPTIFISKRCLKKIETQCYITVLPESTAGISTRQFQLHRLLRGSISIVSQQGTHVKTTGKTLHNNTFARQKTKQPNKNCHHDDRAASVGEPSSLSRPSQSWVSSTGCAETSSVLYPFCAPRTTLCPHSENLYLN